MAAPPKVYVVKRKLATGQIAHYHYAWKGGPRIAGLPGTPEYHRSLASLLETRSQPHGNTLAKLVAEFQHSGDYEKLSDHTKRAYRRHLAEIQDRFGDMEIPALDDKRVRRPFLEYRDEFKDRPRTADMALGTLKRLLSWSVSTGYLTHNHAEPIGRLHSADKSDDVWTADDVAAFIDNATPELSWVILLAIATGLRQGDLLRLSWNHIQGDRIIMRTSKRKRRVEIPLSTDCLHLLRTIPRRSTAILTTHKGHRAWTPDGFRASFGKVCDRAGITKTFHDLRGTAVTEAIANGNNAAALALIFGWSESRVDEMKRIYGGTSKIVDSMLARMKKAEYETASAANGGKMNGKTV